MDRQSEVRPGQMQAPDFTTSALRSSMTLRLLHFNKADELDSTVAAQPREASVSLAIIQQKLHLHFCCDCRCNFCSRCSPKHKYFTDFDIRFTKSMKNVVLISEI